MVQFPGCQQSSLCCSAPTAGTYRRAADSNFSCIKAPAYQLVQMGSLSPALLYRQKWIFLSFWLEHEATTALLDICSKHLGPGEQAGADSPAGSKNCFVLRTCELQAETRLCRGTSLPFCVSTQGSAFHLPCHFQPICSTANYYSACIFVKGPH